MSRPLQLESKIELRISKELKNKIYTRASSLNKSVSDYIRDMLKKDCEK